MIKHITFATAFAFSIGLAAPALAVDPVYTGFFSSTAASGHDSVAYFTEGKPVEGREKFSHEYEGATWLFSSAENRDLFAADPGRYAPQYGGYCAYAVSQGSTASTDPTAWKIVDGKLYLNYSHDVKKLWEADIPGYVAKANENWPKLLAN